MNSARQADGVRTRLACGCRRPASHAEISRTLYAGMMQNDAGNARGRKRGLERGYARGLCRGLGGGLKRGLGGGLRRGSQRRGLSGGPQRRGRQRGGRVGRRRATQTEDGELGRAARGRRGGHGPTAWADDDGALRQKVVAVAVPVISRTQTAVLRRCEWTDV